MSEDGVGVEAKFLEVMSTKSFCCYRYIIWVIVVDMVVVIRTTLLGEAIIIDGKSLDFVMQSTSIKEEFMSFALRCDSVICCRTSPIQKATITELVRTYGKQICLAIGDGANDVGPKEQK